jgi:DHA1 family tetracycline resistance protein-like MFS transporter
VGFKHGLLFATIVFMPKRNPRALPTILLAIFLDLVGYGILVPVVPQLFANPDSVYYILSPGVPLSVGYILLGFLIATYPLAQFFSAPILGQYSDRHGRRPVLTLALAGTAIAFLIFAIGILSHNIFLLFFSRALDGILGGNISVAQAAIADLTKPKERAKHFGLIGAAYGTGFIIGPVLGGVLSDPTLFSWFSITTPFLFAAALSALNAFLVYRYVGETNKRILAAPIKLWQGVADIVRAYGMKRLRSVFATNFFFNAGITFVATFFSVYLIDRFQMTQIGIGYYIGYAGLWIVISQAVLVPLLSKYYDEVVLLRWSLILGSLGIFSFYLPYTIPGLLLAGAFFALANGISMALLPSLASRRAPASLQGEILGINTSIQAFAQATPPVLAGFIAATIAPSAPVYIAGAAVGLGWIVFMIFVRREKLVNVPPPLRNGGAANTVDDLI